MVGEACIVTDIEGVIPTDGVVGGGADVPLVGVAAVVKKPLGVAGFEVAAVRHRHGGDGRGGREGEDGNFASVSNSADGTYADNVLGAADQTGEVEGGSVNGIGRIGVIVAVPIVITRNGAVLDDIGGGGTRPLQAPRGGRQVVDSERCGHVAGSRRYFDIVNGCRRLGAVAVVVAPDEDHHIPPRCGHGEGRRLGCPRRSLAEARSAVNKCETGKVSTARPLVGVVGERGPLRSQSNTQEVVCALSVAKPVERQLVFRSGKIEHAVSMRNTGGVCCIGVVYTTIVTHIQRIAASIIDRCADIPCIVAVAGYRPSFAVASILEVASPRECGAGIRRRGGADFHNLDIIDGGRTIACAVVIVVPLKNKAVVPRIGDGYRYAGIVPKGHIVGRAKYHHTTGGAPFGFRHEPHGKVVVRSGAAVALANGLPLESNLIDGSFQLQLSPGIYR